MAPTSSGTVPGTAFDTPLGTVASSGQDRGTPPREPVLCVHCGRTASNGIVCQGICVADSGY